MKWIRIGIIVLIGVLIGVPVGISTATFLFAEGHTYLMNSPEACANCHVMKEPHEAWMASSHHGIAACNDCHTSGGTLRKYSQKALNGFLHSWAFTLGTFREPLRIKEFNRKIVLENCNKCHSQFLMNAGQSEHHVEQSDCLKCHQQAGHRRW